MYASTNMKAVRTAYHRLAEDDLDSFLTSLDPGFVAVQPDAVPWRGTYRGADGVRAMARTVAQHADWSFEPTRFVEGQDGCTVVVLGRTSIRPPGATEPIRLKSVHVWSVTAGRLLGVEVLLDTPATPCSARANGTAAASHPTGLREFGNGMLSAVAGRLLQTRPLVRAPIWLYRHRLGWVVGPRLLMLEHLGRKSGRSRYVCLEVVDEPAPDTLLIVSGFGTRAQWYRNLLAHPDCFVSHVRRHRVPAHARPLSDLESTAALDRYRVAHPQAWKRLRGAIERAIGEPIQHQPLVELRLRAGASEPTVG